MLDFGIRKQGFFIQVAFEESTGDNTVTIELTNTEGETTTYTGTIILDD